MVVVAGGFGALLATASPWWGATVLAVGLAWLWWAHRANRSVMEKAVVVANRITRCTRTKGIRFRMPSSYGPDQDLRNALSDVIAARGKSRRRVRWRYTTRLHRRVVNLIEEIGSVAKANGQPPDPQVQRYLNHRPENVSEYEMLAGLLMRAAARATQPNPPR